MHYEIRLITPTAMLIPMDEETGRIGKCAMFQKRTFNLNDRVLVKLTDWGKEQLLKKGWTIPVENESGQSDWQFNQLMLALGEDCYCSSPTPFHAEVEFIKP